MIANILHSLPGDVLFLAILVFIPSLLPGKPVFRAIFVILASFIFSLPVSASSTETAIFAGGCFWSMQHDFEKVDGILSTTVGYTGGTVPHPTYEQVSSGATGHYEAIKISYDPAFISYDKLVDLYWHDIDPTDAKGQFCDRGKEYHSAIFYSSPEQKQIALESKKRLMQSKRFARIYTKILPAQPFYPAEDYHQHYSDKNPEAYARYRSGCRRDSTLQKVWGK